MPKKSLIKTIIKISFFSVILLDIGTVYAFDPLLAESKVPKSNITTFNVVDNCSNPNLNIPKLNIFEAVNLGLCRNPETNIAWLSIKEAAASYGVSKSAAMPSVSATVSDEEKHGISTHNKTDNTSTLGASIDWLLFDFGKTRADINKEYFSLVETKYNYNNQVQSLIYNVIAGYCNLFSSKEEVTSAIRSEASYKAANDTAKEKYNLGLVPKADVLKAETNFAQSTLTRQKAENKVAINQGALLKLLNLKQGQSINLEKPNLMQRGSVTNKNIENLIEQAIKDRPDIKALIAKEKAYKAADRSARYADRPSISLYGSSAKTELDDDWNARDFDNTIGVKVSIPIFTGFSHTYSAKKARAELDTVRQEEEKLKNEVGYEIWEAYHNLQNAEDNITVAEKMLISAKESQSLAIGMYKNGKGSMLEVLTAEASYAEAEKERISAEYNIIIAEAALMKAIGKLSSKFVSQ